MILMILFHIFQLSIHISCWQKKGKAHGLNLFPMFTSTPARKYLVEKSELSEDILSEITNLIFSMVMVNVIGII